MIASALAFISRPPNFNLEWTVKAVLSHFALGYLFSLIVYMAWMKISQPSSSGIFQRALFVAFVGACVSIVIDVDHIVNYGRPWHKPFAVLAVIVIFLISLRRWFSWVNKIFKKPIEWQIWALCIILHVTEDYTLGWF